MTNVCDGVRLCRDRIEPDVLEAVSEALGDEVENVGTIFLLTFGGVIVK